MADANSNVNITSFTISNATTYGDLCNAQVALCQYICTNANAAITQYQRLTAAGSSIYPGGIPANLAQLATAMNVWGNAYANDCGLTSIAVAAGAQPAPVVYTMVPAPPTANSNNSTSTANTTG